MFLDCWPCSRRHYLQPTSCRSPLRIQLAGSESTCCGYPQVRFPQSSFVLVGVIYSSFVAVESYMNRHQSMVVEYEQCVGSMWVYSPCWRSAEPSRQELPDRDVIQIYQVTGSRNGEHGLPFCRSSHRLELLVR